MRFLIILSFILVAALSAPAQEAKAKSKTAPLSPAARRAHHNIIVAQVEKRGDSQGIEKEIKTILASLSKQDRAALEKSKIYQFTQKTHQKNLKKQKLISA